MDLRKLIAFGKSTYSITLPKQWVTSQGLGKGALLSVEQLVTGDLLITPRTGKRTTQKTITINANDTTLQGLKREVIAAYVKDYDKIIIKGNLGKRRNQFRELLHELIALEVVEENSDHIIAKCFLDTSKPSLQQTIRRIYYNTKTNAQSLRSLIAQERRRTETKQSSTANTPRGSNETNTSTYESAQELIQRDIEINRQVFYLVKLVVRALNQPIFTKTLGVSPVTAVFFWHIADCLEKIADRTKDIASIVTKGEEDASLHQQNRNEEGQRKSKQGQTHEESATNKNQTRTPIPKQTSERLLEVHDMVFNLLENAMQAVFTKNVAEVNNVIEKTASLRETLVSNVRKEHHPYFTLATAHYREIVLHTRSIAERSIDLRTTER
ncbi:phosphate uptake regulator PhoU [Candidatus Woesearchaeota archaeon]|nr:MAG: phosphate uptake regulator PhoU [Candidatus Woesearchaeota archaeon]